MSEDKTASDRIDVNLDKVLAQIDIAQGYVAELRIASAIFRAAIDSLQEKVRHCTEL